MLCTSADCSSAQVCVGGFQRYVGGILAQGKTDAIGGCGADQRCATHLHHLDGAGGIFQRFQRHDLELVRQPGLVDDVDAPAVLIQPDRTVVDAFDFHSERLCKTALPGRDPGIHMSAGWTLGSSPREA